MAAAVSTPVVPSVEKKKVSFSNLLRKLSPATSTLRLQAHIADGRVFALQSDQD